MARTGLASFSRVLKAQVCEDAFAWLSFAALLAWMFGLYWSNIFIKQVATVHFDFVQLRSIWLAVEACAFATLFILFSVRLRQSLMLVFFAGALTFVGTMIMLFVPSEWESVWHLGGIVCSGVGSALLLVHSGVFFAHEGSQKLLVNVALALFTVSIFDTLLLFLPFDMQRMIVSLLPAAYVCLFVPVVQKRGFAPSAQQSRIRKAGWKAILLRVIALPLIVGLAYGLMQRLTAVSYESVVLEANLATILSFFLSAVIILMSAGFLKTTGIIKLVCFVAIPIIGIAFVLLPLFGTAHEAVQAICIVGFNSFYFMVWALWAGGQEGFPLTRRFVLGLFVLVASESLGSGLGSLLLGLAQESGQAVSVISLVVVYLLLMAGLFSFDRSTVLPKLKSDAAKPKEGEVFGQYPMFGLSDVDLDRNQEAFGLVDWCKRYGLSEREAEVLNLLAKGRNRSYISKTLFVSDNTTRTHMRNIYRKLGVHSQQELIDLLEQDS